MKKFKVLIRVVKSLNVDSYGHIPFGAETVHNIPVIEAVDKPAVKPMLLEMFPQFFQNGKIYERETKDQAQFFYVLIYELHASEIAAIDRGEWICAGCDHVHENRYIARPYKNERVSPGIEYCNAVCFNSHFVSSYSTDELPDNINFIKKESPVYIYKITEKSTGKCYIGKTRNEPVWRWWDHLKKSGSPFGVYLQSKSISDWQFEVIDELPNSLPEKSVFEIESKWILQFNAISNGFNTVISNKTVKNAYGQPEIAFEQPEIEF